MRCPPAPAPAGIHYNVRSRASPAATARSTRQNRPLNPNLDRLQTYPFQKLSSLLDGVVQLPDAAFYLWPPTPGSDTEFAQRLYHEQAVSVLPGSYFAREAHGFNPGRNGVRIALVAATDECVEAVTRIRDSYPSL